MEKNPKADSVGPDSIWLYIYNESSDIWTYGVGKT